LLIFFLLSVLDELLIQLLLFHIVFFLILLVFPLISSIRGGFSFYSCRLLRLEVYFLG
jgi:hypothetical protein